MPQCQRRLEEQLELVKVQYLIKPYTITKCYRKIYEPKLDLQTKEDIETRISNKSLLI
jgi:hypothetical protein